MAEMTDDFDLGDFDDLDLGDDDLDMDLDLGDESDDLGDDLSVDVNPGSDDSASSDIDLGSLEDLPSDEDLSLDEALGDDMDLDDDSLSGDLDSNSDMDQGDGLVDPEDMSLDGEDFDLDDPDEEDGDESFDMDVEENELMEDPTTDKEDFDLEEKEGGSVDLSSLEDELGLDESEQVVAPEVEEIPDLKSEDDLESELAGIGGFEGDEPETEIEDADSEFFNDDGSGSDDLEDDQSDGVSGDVVLDESMEVQELESDEDEIDEDVVDLDALIDATDDDELEEDILAIDEGGISSSNDEMIEIENPEDFDEFDIVEDLIESESISDGAIQVETPVQGAPPSQFRKPEPQSDEGFEANFRSETQSKEPILGKSLLFNLPHNLTVQVGKASLKGADISSLTYGSVIELDRKVGEPVDIVLGNETIAKGEVVQINDEQLGVRITRINC